MTFFCLVFFGFSRLAESGSVPFGKLVDCRTFFVQQFGIIWNQIRNQRKK